MGEKRGEVSKWLVDERKGEMGDWFIKTISKSKMGEERGIGGLLHA